MAFTSLTTQEISTGEPVTNSTMTKVKDNFDNLNTRTTSLEGGSNTIYPPILMRVNGNAAKLSLPYTGFLKTTMNFNITITGVRIITDIAGSSGSTEIDLKFKRGANPYTSIFTSLPTVSHSVGNDAASVNGVLNPTYVDLQTGDILRLDITGVQTAGKNFIVRIDYVKT